MVKFKLENGFMRSDIQEAFTAFYGNPVFMKKSEEGDLSRYVCSVKCRLGNKSRYLICTLYDDSASVIGSRRPLSEIDWETFQAREMEGKHRSGGDMQDIEYVPEFEGLLTDKITKMQCTEQLCMYECDTLPLIVSILHTEEKSSYNMEGSIMTALEVFHTIVSWRSSHNL